MLNLAQRIELMQLATDIAKTKADWSVEKPNRLEDDVIAVFSKLRPCVEQGSALDDTSMSDVKTAVDVASSIGDLLE